MEFYYIAPTYFIIAAFLASLIDKKYFLIVLLIFISQEVLNVLNNKLNIYEIIPLVSLISLALASICLLWKKYMVGTLLFIEFLTMTWYLSYDIHGILNSTGDLLLAKFLYNGLHPSYIHEGIPEWMNIPTLFRLFILLAVTTTNVWDIFTTNQRYIHRVADNFRDVYTYSKDFTAVFIKEFKTKNPKTIFKAWQNGHKRL